LDAKRERLRRRPRYRKDFAARARRLDEVLQRSLAHRLDRQRDAEVAGPRLLHRRGREAARALAPDVEHRPAGLRELHPAPERNAGGRALRRVERQGARSIRGPLGELALVLDELLQRLRLVPQDLRVTALRMLEDIAIVLGEAPLRSRAAKRSEKRIELLRI